MSSLLLWSPHQHLRSRGWGASSAAAYRGGAADDEDDVGDLPSLSRHDAAGGRGRRGAPLPAVPRPPSPASLGLEVCCSLSSSLSNGSPATTASSASSFFGQDAASPVAAEPPTAARDGSRGKVQAALSSFAVSAASPNSGAGTSVHPRRGGAPQTHPLRPGANPFDCDDSPSSAPSDARSSPSPDPDLNRVLRFASHYQYGENGELAEQVEAIILPQVSSSSSPNSSSPVALAATAYPSLLDDEDDDARCDDEVRGIPATTNAPPKGKPPLPSRLPQPRPASSSSSAEGWSTPPRQRAGTPSPPSSPPPSPLSPKLLVQEDLQHLLAGKSAVEAFNFLQMMVIDLLNELEEIQSSHRDQIEEQQLVHAAQARDYALVAMGVQQALERHVVSSSSPEKGDKNAQESARQILQTLGTECDALRQQHGDPFPPTPDTPSSRSGGFLRRSPRKSKPQPPQPAALQGLHLVLDQLTGQLSTLQQQHDKLVDQVQKKQETIDDLTALCETKTFKIEALEQQFASLNQSRSNLAQKLVDRTHQALALRRGGARPGGGTGIPRVVSVAATGDDDDDGRAPSSCASSPTSGTHCHSQ